MLEIFNSCLLNKVIKMTDKENKIKYLNLKKLLDAKQGKYIIPIYQRNYAWGKGEIEQLVDDLYLASKEQGNKNYYIGSLIVYKRENDNYEVIDGQQRLTTLTILYSALRTNKYLETKNELKNLGSNLFFEHREESKNSLDRILNKHNSINKKGNIEVAYEIIKDKLVALKQEDKEKYFDTFLSFLFRNVQILRTEVLPNTDLNHYFEIMNSRGEQLEKHEILKAHFMGMKEKDSELSKMERKLFSMIWDACSDMDRSVVMGFPMEFRKKIFFPDSDEKQSFKSKDFGELLCAFEDYSFPKISDKKDNSDDLTEENNELSNKLSDILSYPEKYLNKDKDDAGKDVNTRSIIDFSNFLIQALKLHKNQPLNTNESSNNNGTIELDDKKMIETFKKELKTLPEIKEFIFNLLKARLCFDKYIIKYTQSSTDDWSLLTPKIKNGKMDYVNTFSEFEEQEKVKLLLSMFQTIYTTRNYKNWLYSILYGFIHQSWSEECYIDELDKLAKGYANKITYLDEGTGVRHFIFNYLDYLIYKKFKDNADKFDEILPEQKYRKDEKKLMEYFKNFKFSYRSSIEHCYPQSSKELLGKWEENTEKYLIDTFGNLCLIEPEFNSSLSDNSIHLKRAKLIELLEKNNKRSASLKQVIMLMYNDDCWKGENARKTIEEHRGKMLKLLGREDKE